MTDSPHGTSAFGGRLGWGRRPAVVVIDLCRAYVTERSSLYDRRFVDAVPSVDRLVTSARRAGVAVLWTRVEFQPGGTDGGVFYRKVPSLASFDRGNPMGDWLVDGPGPAPDEIVVTKQGASAFFGTYLATTLQALGIDTVVLAGYSTSGCVRATAVDACQHGFIPLVVDEACGDRTAAVHAANLTDLDAKYADVIHLDEVLSRWEHA